MKKKNILLDHAGTPVEELPEDLRRFVESDPELHRSFQEQARIAALMNLKNYEQPDASLEGRVLYKVGLRIRNGEHLRMSNRLDAFPDWARMVAVVMVMAALSLLTHREMLEGPALAPPERKVADQEIPMPALETHSFEQSMDPFAPIYVTLDEQVAPNLMTPEFSNQIESSMLKLGLNQTNHVHNMDILPVSYTPLP